MFAVPFIALFFGGLLGLRCNVWALLACLTAVVPVMTATMLLSLYGFAATMLAALVVVTSMQIGYLAVTYSIQAAALQRTLRSASARIDR